MNLLVQWDENKNQKNIAKHGIGFGAAASIFLDEERIEIVDDRNDYGEERLQVIGQARPGILFVVYTWRNENTVRRLISARVANKNECQMYNDLKMRK